jgi:hypothetical protein
MKQETLEEFAERILANNIDGLRAALKDDDLFFFYKGVIQCYGQAMVKWQMERSYSEEEVIELLASYAEWTINGDCLYYEWFEQFKKK